jgi:hypothetical protein
VGGWRPVIPSIPDRVSYAWLSDHELLYFQNTGTASRVMHLDVRTGAEWPASGPHGPLTLPGNGWLLSVSPDAQWLLWKRWWKLPTFHEAMYTTRVDGSHTSTWPVAGDDTSTWLPGSRTWLDLPTLGQYGARPLAGLPIGHLYRIDGSGPQPVHLTGVKNPAWILGVLANGHGLAALDGPSIAFCRSGTFRLAEFGIGNATVRTHEYRVPVPWYTLDGYVALSPHGDRLLWVLQRDRPPLGIGVLGDWAASNLRHPVAQADEIWVSGVDGADLHEVGRTPYRNGNRGAYLCSCQWLPDGKRISFVYNHTLYVVPAD